MSNFQQPLRLNLGGGPIDLPGFVNVDRIHGREAYPLAYPDHAAEEIVASHILEHFGNQEVAAVLREWVRVLKPGGTLRVAVPDIQYISHQFLQGNPNGEPLGSYLMGGQTTPDDFHKSVFCEERLRNLMEEAGLYDLKRWSSDREGDCARLPVSLNLEGTKAGVQPLTGPLPPVAAVMSIGRLAFSDNMFCALHVAHQLGIPFQRYTGAFWGQCLERALEEHLHDGTKYVLTIDYDTVFTVTQVRQLLALMEAHPEVDALCPVQVKRGEDCPLMGILREDGSKWPVGEGVPMDYFRRDLTRLYWGHFGLTLLRTERLRDLPHPWFLGVPNEHGRWEEGRLDDDLYFWKQWTETGRTLYMANRIAVGHGQYMVSWPSREGNALHQHANEAAQGRRPDNVWV